MQVAQIPSASEHVQQNLKAKNYGKHFNHILCARQILDWPQYKQSFSFFFLVKKNGSLT